MEDIVQSALDNADKEYRGTDAAREFGDPEIVAIGCADAGIGAVEHVGRTTSAVDTVAITAGDHADRAQSETDFRYRIDSATVDQALGFGVPNGGPPLEETALARRLADALERADLCFIHARLTTPIAFAAASAAAVAVEQSSALGIGLFTATAPAAGSDGDSAPVRTLLSTVDMATLIDLERARAVTSHPEGMGTTRPSAPEHLTARFTVNAAATITEPSLINLDYADLTSIWHRGDIGTLATGTVEMEPRGTIPESACREMIEQPLYPVDIEAVRGCWVHLTGGPDLTLKAAEEIAQRIVNHPGIGDGGVAIWSARIVDDYEGSVDVEALLTGLSVDDLPGVPRPE